MHDQRGQGTAEWVALLLVVVITLTGGTALAAGAAAPWLPRALRCAVLTACGGEDRRLGETYGDEVAAFVRGYAPNLVYERGTLTLPVDFRRCRRHRCADAPDAGGSDVWRSSRGGQHATVFVHAVDRRPAGDLFIQYWLYYPDSTYNGTAYATSKLLAHTPAGWLSRKLAGHHEDDWESYQLRIDRRGMVLARASAHHGYSGRRRWPNLNELPDRFPRRRTGAWTAVTGWTRVSRGSHAGHIVDGPGGERLTRADGLVLVPIEALAEGDRATGFAITPPWEKGVYDEPEQTST